MGHCQAKVQCLADLVRAVQPVPKGLNMDFLRASSYTGAATTGQDAVEMGLVSKIPIQGRHILLVEDIIDTGKTLQVSTIIYLSVRSYSRGSTLRQHSQRIQKDYCLQGFSVKEHVPHVSVAITLRLSFGR